MMTTLDVRAIAWTHLDTDATRDISGGWEPDTSARDGESLAEFAGRACYQSWSKPNPATATNAGYLRHILDVGHLSVLEHGTVTMHMQGVSRSFTHELVRHRHFSYSQLSQRYARPNGGRVVPPLFAGDEAAERTLAEAAAFADMAYDRLVYLAEALLADVADGTARRKQAREAARAVLPNMSETKIVVTGNYRAWRHFVALRATRHADAEIRAGAVACLRELQRVAPSVFADFQVHELPDGSEAAHTNFAERS